MNICICYYEYYIEYNYNLLHNYILYIGIPQAQHISVYKYMNISHIIIIFAVTIVNDNAVNLYVQHVHVDETAMLIGILSSMN